MARKRQHRWSARQRLTIGPFYRTLSASASRQKGLTTRTGGWSLKVTRTLHVNIAERAYGWNHDGPGAVSGPVPHWRIMYPLAVVVAFTRWAAFGSLRRFGIATAVVLLGLYTLGVI